MIDTHERLSDAVRFPTCPHVTRVLGQNPGVYTMQGTNTYLLQPPSNPLAPLILIDTSSPHTAQQYVDCILTHLFHLGLQSGVREVFYNGPHANAVLKYTDKEKHDAVKLQQYQEHIEDPRKNDLMLVEYGPGSGWVPNSTQDRRLPHVEHIILTHRHLDHVGALPLLLKTLKERGCPPPKLWKFPSPDEAQLALDPKGRLTTDATLWENLVPGTYTGFSPFQPFHPIMPGLMISIIDPKYRHLLKYDQEGQPKWNEVPEMVRVSVKCMRTPGVTADSVSLILQEGERGVFTGDTVLGENGPARFTDLATYLTSLKVLVALKPPAIYPGHGQAIHGHSAVKAYLEGIINSHSEETDHISNVLRDVANGKLGELMHEFHETNEERKRQKAKYDEEFNSGVPARKVKQDKRTPEQKAKDKEEYVAKFQSSSAALGWLVRLVKQTADEKKLWGDKGNAKGYLSKLEKDGKVKKTLIKGPKMVGDKVGEVEEQEAWEWVEEGV